MGTLHPKVCLLFRWLKNSLYRCCQSHLSHGLRHSDRISSTIYHRATLRSGGNTTHASRVPGSLVGPRGLQGAFVQAMATLGPPLSTGTPETPLLSQGPCLSLCPILSPWTLPARLGLFSRGGGQHAPCSSGFPAASQPGSLMGLRATSPKQISASVCSQQMVHPLTHSGRFFLLYQEGYPIS